jgi:hypothetical protein
LRLLGPASAHPRKRSALLHVCARTCSPKSTVGLQATATARRARGPGHQWSGRDPGLAFSVGPARQAASRRVLSGSRRPWSPRFLAEGVAVTVPVAAPFPLLDRAMVIAMLPTSRPTHTRRQPRVASSASAGRLTPRGPASACVSGSAELADGSFDAVGKLYVVLRDSLGHVGPEGEMHPAPADVHVWMVVHLFRDLGDLVHQADGGGKVRRDGGPAQRLVVTRPPWKIVELSFDLVSVEDPRWHRRKG